MNEKQRLRFITEFAKMRLTGLREGDWLNLLEDFGTFLGLGEAGNTLASLGGITTNPKRPHPKQWSKDDVKTLHIKTKALLGKLVRGKPNPNSDSFQVSQPESFEFAGTFALLMLPDGGIIEHVKADSRQLFLYMVKELLKRRNNSDLLSCPECHAIFIRVRRQKYCSSTCTNRVAKRGSRNGTSKGMQKESS